MPQKFIDIATDMDLLDFIDLIFHYLCYISQYYSNNPLSNLDKGVLGAIEELNDRFQQHKLGYEFVDGALLRIDNKFIHCEYVKPALNLLHNKEFSGAEEEYVNAFDALRKHDVKNAIINAEKSFESAMKTICIQRGYSFDSEKDTAKRLINILKENDYFPRYLEDHLNTVTKALENGAPTIRNKIASHGQGKDIIAISDIYAEYIIGLVAVNIVYLVELL